MNETMRKFVRGLLVGMVSEGVMPESKRTPIAYSYNGVVLPDINTVWTDKETYPYAFIMSVSGYPYDAPYCILWICNRYTLVDDGSGYMGLGVKSLQVYHLVPHLSSAWQFYEEQNGNATYTVNVNWSSVDVVGEDGTLYLAASEPIPVYE